MVVTLQVPRPVPVQAPILKVEKAEFADQDVVIIEVTPPTTHAQPPALPVTLPAATYLAKS